MWHTMRSLLYRGLSAAAAAAPEPSPRRSLGLLVALVVVLLAFCIQQLLA